MVRWSWPGWWLGLLVGIESPVAAQANGPPRIELKENYPNPFFPATTIPFEIGPELCAKGRQPVVSLKIYNVLVQVVAIPLLAAGSDERVDSLRLRCGRYRSYWDGKYLDGKAEATPGIYYSQLTVDGERFTRKMIVRKKATSEQ